MVTPDAAAASTAVAGTGPRQLRIRVAHRVFTEQPPLQVDVVSHLLGYPTVFARAEAWTFPHVSPLLAGTGCFGGGHICGDACAVPRARTDTAATRSCGRADARPDGVRSDSTASGRRRRHGQGLCGRQERTP